MRPALASTRKLILIVAAVAFLAWWTRGVRYTHKVHFAWLGGAEDVHRIGGDTFAVTMIRNRRRLIFEFNRCHVFPEVFSRKQDSAVIRIEPDALWEPR